MANITHKDETVALQQVPLLPEPPPEISVPQNDKVHTEEQSSNKDQAETPATGPPGYGRFVDVESSDVVIGTIGTNVAGGLWQKVKSNRCHVSAIGPTDFAGIALLLDKLSHAS
ncbi:uncharacterized protein N0V89_011255 [Didymosphaeria variabile]|uniref:Uncharacterized protein n=1 Tax=Didymosphaeria variabile TaxID=1932322 RepID=A0A9W9C687_9PLEO|nr:uncharacterized protein N0V89_011255 [Didymosphaeria variabile]KAJ4347315.1 hypothetical protein N0V89_011255 [Didymosphaeria variabile]